MEGGVKHLPPELTRSKMLSSYRVKWVHNNIRLLQQNDVKIERLGLEC